MRMRNWTACMGNHGNARWTHWIRARNREINHCALTQANCGWLQTLNARCWQVGICWLYVVSQPGMRRYPEYIRGRVCNSQSFCYGCCHGRISSSSSLPTSVCPKKKLTLLSSSVELSVEHCTLTNTCMQRADPHGSNCQSKRSSFQRERAGTCSAVSA